MVAHRAGGELHAVAHEVVLVGGDAERVDLATFRLQQRVQPAGGHGERVVAEFQLARLLADLVHREIDDPAELVALLIKMPLAGRPEGLNHRADGLVLRGQNSEGIRREVKHRLGLRPVHELGHAAGDIPCLVGFEPVALAAADHLDVREQLFDLLARQNAARNGDGLDLLILERPELRALEEGGHVLRGQVDAQIGLVGSVGLQRVEVGDAPEGRFGRDMVRSVLRENRRQHLLTDVEHILLRGEGHLHVELVELTGAAVAAGVLVAEAGGDLEVAVEARGHEELLELLRRLGQRVELSRVFPRGHEIVSGALRRGGGQDRRSDLYKPLLGHGAAQRGDDVAAQQDIPLHRRVAQVEVPVL